MYSTASGSSGISNGRSSSISRPSTFSLRDRKRAASLAAAFASAGVTLDCSTASCPSTESTSTESLTTSAGAEF